MIREDVLLKTKLRFGLSLAKELQEPYPPELLNENGWAKTCSSSDAAALAVTSDDDLVVSAVVVAAAASSSEQERLLEKTLSHSAPL